MGEWRAPRAFGGAKMNERASITGETIVEAEFDSRISSYLRLSGSLWMCVTVVGIPLIPFWLLISLWYCPEYLRRVSARLTTQAVELQKGVFFRSEATIPLDRITDVRLHDGPVMRMFGLRGIKIETAGQSGDTGSEGNLIGVIDAVEIRDSVLLQRQAVQSADQEAAPSSDGDGTTALLSEIRDILARMEAKG